MKWTIGLTIIVTLCILIAGSCARNRGGVLVSQKFLDNHTYEIVCRGYAAEGTQGIARMESAKRSALMNIYAYLSQTFEGPINVSRDGRVEKVEVEGNAVKVYYILKKRNLKGMIRRG